MSSILLNWHSVESSDDAVTSGVVCCVVCIVFGLLECALVCLSFGSLGLIVVVWSFLFRRAVIFEAGQLILEFCCGFELIL